MDLSIFLSVLAVIITFFTFVFYNKDVLKGDIGPTMISWLLWSFITVVGTTTYQFANGDWVKTAAILTDCLGGLVTTCIIFIVAFRKDISFKDFFFNLWKRMDRWQKSAAITSAASLVIWPASHSAYTGNFILLAGYAIAFAPNDPKNEKPAPWLAWAAAHTLIVAVVIMRWQDNWLDLIPPIVYALLHAALGFLALENTRKA